MSDPTVDRDREIAELWERIAFDQARATDPSLTLDEYRVRHDQELREWRKQRDADKAAREEWRRAKRQAEHERTRELLLRFPRATAKDLELIEGFEAQVRPGETWGELARRLQELDDRFDTFIRRLRGDRIHERECSQLRADGMPCRAWAMRGSDRCYAHAKE